MDTLGLVARKRVGKNLTFVSIEAEFVKVARASVWVDAFEKAVAGWSQGDGALAPVDDGVRRVFFRCPDTVADPGVNRESTGGRGIVVHAR